MTIDRPSILFRQDKITKLTAEQEVELVTFRERVRRIGTRTGHDDECVALGRSAINDAYREVGVDPPKYVLWAQSPLQAVLMHLAMRRMPKAASLGDQLGCLLWDQLQGQLRDQLGGQLGGTLGDHLEDKFRDQLRSQLEGQLENQLGGQLWSQLGGQFGDQCWGWLLDQLRDQLEGQLGNQPQDPLGGWLQFRRQLRDPLRETWNQRWYSGQCEMYWIGLARFAISLGVKVSNDLERRLTIMERLARSAFMAFSWKDCTILVQHPSVAKFDQNRRLHCADGPALAWPDGYAVYAVNGVRLSPDLGAW